MCGAVLLLPSALAAGLGHVWLTWATALLLISLLPVLWRGLRPAPAGAAAAAALARKRLWCVADAALWSLGTLLLFPHADPAGQGLLSLVFAGAAAATVVGFRLEAVHAARAWLVALLPLVYRLTGEAHPLAWPLAAALLMCGAALLLGGQRRSRQAVGEPASRVAADLLEQAADIASLGAWRWPRGGGHLHLSASARRLFGIAPDRPLGLSGFLECFEPAARHVLLEAMQRAASDGAAFDLDLSATPVDGRPLRLRVWGRPETRAGRVVRLDGALQSSAAMVPDIAANGLMRTIVDHMLEGVVAAAGQGRIVAFNPAAERLFGWSAAEVLGRNVALLMPAAEAAQHASHVARYVGGGRGRVVGKRREQTGRRRDGSEFPIEIGVTTTARGNDLILVALLRDISDRLATEAALRAARDQAETAGHAKSAFLANMSHEIRTPLNGLLGMAELLSQVPLPEQEAKYVATMRRSGRLLMSLLNDILDLTKMEAGMFELERRPFDLCRTVQSSIELMASTASRKGLRLSLAFAPDAPRQVEGDPMRLQQVLNNLIGNAIKFTGDGTVRVTVDPEPRLGPAGVRVCVADSGPGIAAERIDGLFEPFVQADASTARRHGGTGLGLSIVRHIVRQMGGEVDVGSTPGRGSTFCFTARLAVATAAPVESRFDNLGVPAEMVDDESPLQLLLVDDDAVNRLYAEAALRRLGHGVVSAEDGAQAVDVALGSGRFDAILMDGHMPGMDGFEATRHIREHEQASEAARHWIVALTASATAQERQHCLDSGMDDFLAKPFTLQELRLMLDRVPRRRA